MNDFIDTKLSTFSKVLVAYPLYEKAIAKILHSIDVTRTRSEPSSAMLLGEAGTGKSTVCESIVDIMGPRANLDDNEGKYRYIPALLCSISSKFTTRSLSQEILAKLECQDYSERIMALEHRIKIRLKTCRTKVIVLDEFHHLLDKGAEKTRETLCNWVKSLTNETLVPIILVGTPRCEAIVDAHPQLARRYPFRARLKNFGYDSIFRNVLTTLIREMVRIGELKPETFITDDHAAKIFYVYTGGNLNALRLLLQEILESALNRNGNTLTRDDCISGLDRLDLPPYFPLRKNAFELDQRAINNYISRHEP